MRFDSDKSNSLEIEELVKMLIENYVSPGMDEDTLKHEDWALQDFVK